MTAAQSNVVEMQIPNNTDAERAVLAAILRDNNVLAVVRGVLTAEDFFLPHHRHIYTTMIKLIEGGTPVDLVTLIEKLDSLRELQASGGAPYIAALGDPLLLVSNVEHHAAIVREKHIRRLILNTVCAIEQEANHGLLDVGKALEVAEGSFRELRLLGDLKKQETFQTINDYEGAQTMTCAIENFLQQDAGNAIAGLSGHGKTWIGLSIARALLFGPGTLWGLFKVPERAERVIYLIPESTIGPFKHRLKLMHLYDEIRTGRLLTRTLSKGPTLPLQDARLLEAVKGADVIGDTAIRFMGNMTSENDANEAAKGLSEDLFALLRAGARSVLFLFHSPKFFSSQSAMTLENMIRGSSEFGASLATAWGIKQIDAHTNTIHIQNLKARDFDPCGPFQIIGRPFIDSQGDFKLYKSPEECGSLLEEQPDLSNKANTTKHDEKTRRVATVRAWRIQDPNMTSHEMIEKFGELGESVTESTIKKYRMLAAQNL